WLPTHVQVTVVRARGLRCKGGGGGKGKAGGSDAYTVIQLGREKYSTSVAEKSGGSPEWREECAFELPPEPGPSAGLVLTVMHRALVGMDRFLGQALVPLEPARQRGREPDERWHKLHSKAGKKEKERGEILVSIQFTRNSLTASMFDLSVKDKPRSPFGKLKDKVTGKKKYDLESASAIIPSSMGALDMEDDYELGGKKSKVKGFFLKNKLRKSSLTQSNTSLGSDSTISSASLSLAANAPEVTKSPSRHGSLSMERSVKDFLPSPKPTHKRAFSDDVSQVSPVLEPKGARSPKPRSEPVSRSSLCINGSHVYGDEAAPRSPAGVAPASAPLPVPGGPRRQDEAFGFAPLHPEPHEAPWGLGGLERAQQRDEPRFIPSPPSLALQEELKVSTKAVTLSNHLGRARMEESNRLESKPTQAAAPLGFPAEPAGDKPPEDTRKEDRKAKGGFFHHGGTRSDAGGRGQGDRGTPVHASAAGDERSKSSGWFGSKEPKESPQKPSLEVSPQVETSSDAPSHFAPCSPAPCPAALPASMPSSNLPPAPGDSQAGCLSPTNPFLNSLQSNPFFEELLADQVLNSPSPTHFLSSFPPGPHAAAELPPADTDPAVPPLPSEWDDTFDAFATSRLKPERKKESFFASVAAEGMAFIDDPDRASPTERSAEPPCQKGSKEESSSAGTNGWMTIATETAPDPSESTPSAAEERAAPESAFGPRPPFLGEGTFEAQSSSRAAACVLPRSSFPPELAPEALPGSSVAAVPPRALGDVAARRFPEPGAEPGAGQEGAFDIRSSVFRLQASMRLEASDGLLKLSSDIRERHVVLSPWTGPRGREEPLPGPALPPPKPPRWFAAAGAVGDGEEGEPGSPHRGRQERWEDSEGPRADVELQRSHGSSEPSVPAPPGPPALGADAAEAGSDWSQPRSSPQMGATDSAKWETASRQELFPEELSIAGLNPPSKLDVGQLEMFWTALEEQEAAGHPNPQPQRSERGESPSRPELACEDGEGRAGEQPEPCAPPDEAEQGRAPTSEEPEGHSAEGRIDFKKADFWKPDRAEERHTQGASALRNPFTLAPSPNSPSNPFVEKPPAPLPIQAVLPEKLEQGDFSFCSLQEEAPGHGLQPTNAPGWPPPLHVSQPPAFSTPFLVAATNPEPRGRPRPAALPAGVPASRRAAQPCPCPQPGDAQASALLVLPRETRPAEKPFCQQTISPHPVKPLSAAQEGSSDSKQQHRASLSSALSNGLDRMKAVTTSSVQPVAPASRPDKSDSKLKDPALLDQSAKYYHLTHDELIQLLLQKEGELSKKEEHIHELENYIDQLLVRIMEQSPTLLQIPLGGGQPQ
ncbi:RFIP5 protein, partial [Callaeas wilsoni]|nr:RFIP5 protein [Callaeas wilsoni]